MKAMYLTLTFVLAVSSWAQQSPSPLPATQQVQSMPLPCAAVPASPSRVKVKVPVWLQKQIDKQQAKLGTTIDVNGMIADAVAPKPCSKSSIPATQPTTSPFAAPKPRTKIVCYPLFGVPDPYQSTIPTKPGMFEADDVVVDSSEGSGNTAKVPCFAIRIDPRSGRYWVTDPISMN